jgi:hypothetical protein
MHVRKLVDPISAIITLLLLACSSGSGDLASVAKVSNPDPTATAVPVPSEDIPEPTADPTATPVATYASEIALPDLGNSLSDFQNLDLAEMMEAVTGSPELMGCLTGALGMSGMMGLMSREPTSEETEILLSCFSDDQL